MSFFSHFPTLLHRLCGFRRFPMTSSRAREILHKARLYRDLGGKLR